MRTRLIRVEDAQYLLSSPLTSQGSNSRELEMAKAVVRVAVEQDLTARQKECVQMYFFQGMTMERIGQELGIGKPTVYRHLQKALGRLRRAMEYAQALMQAAKNADE